MSIDIVGLGPGSADLVTAGTARLLASGRPVILRTRRHPAVAEIEGSAAWLDCDDLYQGGDSFDGVYAAIAARVLDAGRDADVIFAVPGHPLVAEEAVVRVLAGAEEAGVEVRVHPAVSYVDAAAAALRIDLGGVQLCDALALRIDPRRLALVAQVFDRDAAAALKGALTEVYPADHGVTVLRGLGTASEMVEEVALAEIDHRPWGYLDTLFVPALPEFEDLRTLAGVEAVVRKLHSETGCPWDREQTHESLRKYLLEEAYEVLDAIDSGDPDGLAEEAGDVLLQVLMHACVAEREGTFTLGDITEGLGQKLIRRHPHVFADGDAKTPGEVSARWDELKAAEKGRTSALDGVPIGLAALAQAQALLSRGRKAGFEWEDLQGPIDKLREEVEEFAMAADAREREAEFGDILFVAAGIAQRHDVDAELALRGAISRFRARFTALEADAAARGIVLKGADEATLLDLWARAKQTVAANSRQTA